VLRLCVTAEIEESVLTAGRRKPRLSEGIQLAAAVTTLSP